MPRYFYVPEDNIDREQNYPNTGPRKACEEPGLFLWNQAMFILAQLLTGGLLHMNELDPIRRYLPSYNRPRKGGRYSAFQVSFSICFYFIHFESFCFTGKVMLILLCSMLRQAKPSIVSNVRLLYCYSCACCSFFLGLSFLRFSVYFYEFVFQIFFLQQGTATDLVVQIVLIAESMRLQAMMATYGIQTQTPHEVEPVQIWSSTQLVKVYENLGVNYKLGLQGRPVRPVGSLGTSKVFII